MLARSRVDQRRPGHHQNLPAGLAGQSYLRGDLLNDSSFGFFARDIAGHKLEGAGPFRRALYRNDADAMVANGNAHAFAHLGKLDGLGFLFLEIDSDTAIHRGRLRFDPFAIQMNEGLLVGGHVKVRWENAIGRGRHEFDSGLLDYVCAMLPQSPDHGIDALWRRTEDINQRVTWVVPLSANFDIANGECATAGQNLVQHLRQNQRVNEVSAQL